MKNILMILSVATLVSCSTNASTEATNNDSTVVVVEIDSTDIGLIDLSDTIDLNVTTTLTEADSSATE